MQDESCVPNRKGRGNDCLALSPIYISALRCLVAEVNAFGGLCRNDIPVVAIETLAVDHLLHAAVFQLNIGRVCKAAFQTHFRLEEPDHL